MKNRIQIPDLQIRRNCASRFACNIGLVNLFISEISTQDNYPVGDLSNKLGTSSTWDTMLPLKHEWSVAHRALVLYR